MSIKHFLDDTRTAIGSRVRDLLEEYRTALGTAGSISLPGLDRIQDFTLSGKMIRGCLVVLGHNLFIDSAKAITEGREVIDAACAMEFFQSGLLIHDDIMDKDTSRRGQPTIHVRYQTDAQTLGSTEAPRAGEALGICAGDICFFLGQDALSRSIPRCPTLRDAARLSSYCALELSKVGFAQMQDVLWGLVPSSPSTAEILTMYTHKTARYTFSMPLSVGALLAGSGDALPLLEQFGVDTGIAFQIRDDELGLFGDEAELGKPVGSDIREGKKTLFMTTLFEVSDSSQRERLGHIFGNPHCTTHDIAYVCTLLEQSGTRTSVNERASYHIDHAMSSLTSLEQIFHPTPASMQLLRELTVYATNRSR